MIKILLIICLLMHGLFAQEINFPNAKTYTLNELKEKFKTKEVGVFNYITNSVETFIAFDFKEVLNTLYGEQWKKNKYIRFKTLDKYEPIIEIYKFTNREPYLAFQKKYSQGFNMAFSKSKIVDLAPYFLIWVEDYKSGAARRFHHWPHKVTGVEFIKFTPLKIMPVFDAKKDVFWGYKNYVKQCIACHAINGFGGDKAGELLKDDILAKDDKELMRYISNPKYFNKKAKMPAFPIKIDMRTTRIKNIVKYIRYISKRDFKNFDKEHLTGPKRKVKMSELEDIIEELP